MIKEERPEWPLQKLKGMYFARHCWRCKKFELPEEEYKERCEENIQKIIDNLKIKTLQYREFNEIIKNSTFCQFEKREYTSCELYKKLKSSL